MLSDSEMETEAFLFLIEDQMKYLPPAQFWSFLPQNYQQLDRSEDGHFMQNSQSIF